jgi:hypothetical protein
MNITTLHQNILSSLIGDTVGETSINLILRRILYFAENDSDGFDRAGTNKELWRMILGQLQGIEISPETNHNLVLRMIIAEIDGTLPAQQSEWDCLFYLSENLASVVGGEQLKAGDESWNAGSETEFAGQTLR